MIIIEKQVFIITSQKEERVIDIQNEGELATRTGFKLLRSFLPYSNAETRRPNKYNRQRCSFSKKQNLRETLLPP